MKATSTNSTPPRLTTPLADFLPGRLTRTWVIEFDLAYGLVQVCGEANVIVHADAGGTLMLECGHTDGRYYPHILPDEVELLGDQVELLCDGARRLAVFPTEAAMRAGARAIVRGFGAELPVGIADWLSPL